MFGFCLPKSEHELLIFEGSLAVRPSKVSNETPDPARRRNRFLHLRNTKSGSHSATGITPSRNPLKKLRKNRDSGQPLSAALRDVYFRIARCTQTWAAGMSRRGSFTFLLQSRLKQTTLIHATANAPTHRRADEGLNEKDDMCTHFMTRTGFGSHQDAGLLFSAYQCSKGLN